MSFDLRFAPYEQAEHVRHVMVDGSGNHNSTVTLSHWPGNATPAQFKADLSAEIVLNFVEDPSAGQLLDGAEVATNNHFDEDGLVALYSLLNPKDALESRDFLVEVARAGDFSCTSDRDAARVAWVISAWTDPDRSPLNRTVFGGTHAQLNAVLYEELLERLPAIIEKIGHFEKFWKSDDIFLDLTEDFIARGEIELFENPEADLVVAIIPDGGIHGQGRPPEHAHSWISSVCHPMAIHNASQCKRVLVMKERRFEFYYRYETWVEFVSSKIKPRVELADLARRLNEAERGGTRWRFSGVGDIIGRLSMSDKSESRLSPNQFLKIITEELLAADG